MNTEKSEPSPSEEKIDSQSTPKEQTDSLMRTDRVEPNSASAELSLETESVLFRVGRGYQRGLNNNRISRGLRAAFRKHGIRLSQNATVSIETPESQWLIIDADGLYTIQKNGKELHICAEPRSAVSEESAEVVPVMGKGFPIVGIGASAGGLEAFTQLLEHLPTDTGIGFVLVQHLAPEYQSMLTEILSKATKMPVNEVKDGMEVEPNHVYVIPPNATMAILHGVLHLTRRTVTHGQHMPIDFFFRSLAEDQGSTAIGVILSGTASDGALGLKAIKAEGGITFAQDEETAKYPGMPRSAIAAGYVDFILPPDKIAQELARIGRHPYVNHIHATKSDEFLPASRDELSRIIILLRRTTGVDFTHYKHSTIKRRIARRMVLHKIDQLSNYVADLQENPQEVEALYHDILINVTSFFRDPEAFDTLANLVFPKMMENRFPETPIRIWVPGCSTGEEAYSIAICLLEYMGNHATNTPIQIFATDISDVAIEKARAGTYLENITLDISPERLRRFFVKVEHGYQISKLIRDMCIFAKQDVAKDPPFSKLDLISCRNVLIYLGAVLQKRVMPIFHYALNPNGFLMLGISETIGEFSDLFALVDNKHKIFAKKITAPRPHLDFSSIEYRVEKLDIDKVHGGEQRRFDLQKEVDKIVLDQYAPAGVVVTHDFEILQFRGRTGAYLEPAPGVASFNLLKMAREGLLLDLRIALHKAREENVPIRREGLQVKSNGDLRRINVEVTPIQDPTSHESYFLVVFEEMKPAKDWKPSADLESSHRSPLSEEEDYEMTQLRQELETTKAYLQSIIKEQEVTNEELRSANEEIQSSNEELQSINEELETAKEELQSTNEELITVNEELEHRNTELSQVNNDLMNLIGSVQIPIIMLGNDLRIRRFTAMAEKVLNLIPSDIGRKISDIKPNVDLPDLEPLVLEVIDTLGIVERELQDRDGAWHSLRIRPYKTMENKIDGVVLTFVDIDVLKRNAVLQESSQVARAILDAIPEPLLVLDPELQIVTANRALYQIFQVSKEEMENQPISEVGNGLWTIPNFRKLLEGVIDKNSVFDGFEVEHHFPNIGRRRMRLKGRPLVQEGVKTKLILLTMEDITEGM